MLATELFEDGPTRTHVQFTEDQKDEMLKWASILEKTTRLQGRNRLHDKVTGGYCCLGVYAVETLPEKEWTEEIRWRLSLGNELHARLGTEHTLHGVTLGNHFAIMNDILRLTFSEIAVIIRFLVEHGRLPKEIVKRILEKMSTNGL